MARNAITFDGARFARNSLAIKRIGSSMWVKNALYPAQR
jgi:hypothetical protein